MKKTTLGCLLLSLSQPVLAAPYVNWSGGYFGLTAGVAHSQFDSKAYAQAGVKLSTSQANDVNRVGNQRLYFNGFITGIDTGYNWQFNQVVLGLESDLQVLSTYSDNHTGAIRYSAVPGNQFVLSSYLSNNWLFTARPRIGFVSNNWMLFATGGLGLAVIEGDFAFTSSGIPGGFLSRRVSQVRAGYVVGAGVEAAVSKTVSLKAEYRFQAFGNTSAHGMGESPPKGQPFTNIMNLNTSVVQLGINYHFNNQTQHYLYPNLLPAIFNEEAWQTELGVRAFTSTGLDGAPNPLLDSRGAMLDSRLLFKDLTAYSGETFFRADHRQGLFFKGMLGAGSIRNGQLNDEDFPAFDAYSNTLSKVLGNFSYATIDIGYSPLQAPAGKVGGFIGYNYYAENMSALGCHQLAGSTVCVPTSRYEKILGITQQDRINAFRIGMSSLADITEKINLSAEAAFLPFVNYRGQDNHILRQLIGPENANYGNGAMLESVINYRFKPNWQLGLGARYWMWNMRKGLVKFNFLGQNTDYVAVGRYNSYRYGAFLQLSYTSETPNRSHELHTPANWQGLFVGGHLGGGFGVAYWNDPFPSAPSGLGGVDVAGFGDDVRVNGPFTGANLQYNWQRGRVVYGLGSALSFTDVRGENTLFSGLGGVDGSVINNYLGMLFGRLGTTYERSLFYLNAGTAVLNTKYIIDANTGIVSLGAESRYVTHWGWLAGVGVETALTDHWSSALEYDYVGIPRNNVSFNQLPTINQQTIAVDQAINLVKLSLNYKF